MPNSRLLRGGGIRAGGADRKEVGALEEEKGPLKNRWALERSIQSIGVAAARRGDQVGAVAVGEPVGARQTPGQTDEKAKDGAVVQ